MKHLVILAILISTSLGFAQNVQIQQFSDDECNGAYLYLAQFDESLTSQDRQVVETFFRQARPVSMTEDLKQSFIGFFNGDKEKAFDHLIQVFTARLCTHNKQNKIN